MIDGGDGDDIIEGGAGADVLKGSIGFDTVSYLNAGSGVTVDLGRVDIAQVGSGDAQGDRLSGFECLRGSTYGDQLTGDAAANEIYGRAGDDVLDGAGGADLLVGEAGNDTFRVDNTGDRVTELKNGGTRDTVIASVNYALKAGIDIEVMATQGGTAKVYDINLTGNELAQTIQGNGGANVLDGGGGADLMKGYAGSDTYYVDNVGDRVEETENGGTQDRVVTSVSYTLQLLQYVEVMGVRGGVATTNDINLTGNTFGQTIYGNNGDNVINGRGGTDTLKGFGGADTFVFGTLVAGRGTIGDFSHAQHDRIDVSAYDANRGAAGNQVFTFIEDRAFSHHAGELRAAFVGSSTIVSGDTNGDAVADFEIALTGHVTLVNGDFVL